MSDRVTDNFRIIDAHSFRKFCINLVPLNFLARVETVNLARVEKEFFVAATVIVLKTFTYPRILEQLLFPTA